MSAIGERHLACVNGARTQPLLRLFRNSQFSSGNGETTLQKLGAFDDPDLMCEYWCAATNTYTCEDFMVSIPGIDMHTDATNNAQKCYWWAIGNMGHHDEKVPEDFVHTLTSDDFVRVASIMGFLQRHVAKFGVESPIIRDADCQYFKNRK